MLFSLWGYCVAVAHRASCCPPLIGFQRCRRHCHWRSCRYRFRWRFRCRCRRSRALAGRRSHFCAGRCRRRRWTGCGGGATAVAGRAKSAAGDGQVSRERARAPGDGTGRSDSGSGSDSGWDSDSGAAAAVADAAAAADTAANWLRSRGCCARTAGGVPTFQTGCSSAAGGFLLLQLGLPWCSWCCSWRQEAVAQCWWTWSWGWSWWTTSLWWFGYVLQLLAGTLSLLQIASSQCIIAVGVVSGGEWAWAWAEA